MHFAWRAGTGRRRAPRQRGRVRDTQPNGFKTRLPGPVGLKDYRCVRTNKLERLHTIGHNPRSSSVTVEPVLRRGSYVVQVHTKSHHSRFTRCGAAPGQAYSDGTGPTIHTTHASRFCPIYDETSPLGLSICTVLETGTSTNLQIRTHTHPNKLFVGPFYSFSFLWSCMLCCCVSRKARKALVWSSLNFGMR